MSRPLIALVLLSLVAGCARAASVPSPVPAESPSAAGPAAASVQPQAAERLVGESAARPAPPEIPARYRPALVDDYCIDRDLPATIPDDPALTVLDRSYALPPTFVPDDLVPASDAGFTGSSGAMQVSGALIADLAALRAASAAEGLALEVESGYRSYDDQLATYADWVDRIGVEGAAARTARAGHSEHQLGTAIDFVSPGWSGRFGDWAVESAEGAWVAEHGWEYGFVMSYRADDLEASCYGYEPWHYRWIGREAAAAHRAGGGALREFLAGYAGG